MLHPDPLTLFVLYTKQCFVSVMCCAVFMHHDTDLCENTDLLLLAKYFHAFPAISFLNYEITFMLSGTGKHKLTADIVINHGSLKHAEKSLL